MLNFIAYKMTSSMCVCEDIMPILYTNANVSIEFNAITLRNLATRNFEGM